MFCFREYQTHTYTFLTYMPREVRVSSYMQRGSITYHHIVCIHIWNDVSILPMYVHTYYKWKNQMKGDVGMSVHEKERKQEDAYTKTQTHITPSLHLCSEFCLYVVNASGKEKTSSH